MHAPTVRAPTRTWAERVFGRWWRRQSAARQDRFATLGPLALGAAVPGGDRLGVLVPAQRGVRARAGGGAPRHRGRPAADPPAPDREPGAAGAHGARARHAARSTTTPSWSRRRPSRASTPRSRNLIWLERPARPDRRLLGHDLPARDRHQRRRHAGVAAGRERRAPRPRKRSCARARRARPAYSQPFIDSFGNAVFQVQIPLIDHGVFDGTLVAEYSVERLLRYFVPTEVARRHAIIVLDAHEQLAREHGHDAAGRVAGAAVDRRSSCRSRRPRTAWSCAARATAPRSA